MHKSVLVITFLIYFTVIFISHGTPFELDKETQELIPLFPGAYDIQQGKSEDSISVSYLLKIPYPAEEVISFYEDILEQRGWEKWVPSRLMYTTGVWVTFTEKSGSEEQRVDRWISYWIDLKRGKEFMLTLSYREPFPYGLAEVNVRRELLKVYCSLFPFSQKDLDSTNLAEEVDIKTRMGKYREIPVGRILLLKRGDIYAAIKFIDGKSGSAKYEWYLQPDGSLDFSKDNILKGVGEVYIKYQQVEGGLYSINYKESKNFVEFEGIRLEWEPMFSIGFPIKSDPNYIEAFLTDVENIKEIRGFNLEWEIIN